MRLPDWARAKHRHAALHDVKRLLRDHGLNTVCEEARCPNRGGCFSRSTATFMILGSSCTRNCGFCAVDSSGPPPPDPGEPSRIAAAARSMGLKYVVITSVTRDDLKDGGAFQFHDTVVALRNEMPGVGVEVLTPDFMGDTEALETVLSSSPDVFNHNVETVPSLYQTVRPQADYERSINVLKQAKAIAPGITTKSGLMLGLGEGFGEVLDVLTDLRAVGCDFLTIGQYLRPTKKNLPVLEYATPETFDRLGSIARGMGFKYVASFPLARSSMGAEEMYMTEKGAIHA